MHHMTQDRPRVTAVDLAAPPNGPATDRADAPGHRRRRWPGDLHPEAVRRPLRAWTPTTSTWRSTVRPGQAGRYRGTGPTCARSWFPGRNKLLWDQILVPRAARGERLDVLFHHKFSIPLVAPCPTVVQQRGTEYWSHPEFYGGWSGRIDRVYNRLMIPLYCRRAVRVLTNSDTLGDELVRHVGVPRVQAAHRLRRGRRELPRRSADPAALGACGSATRLPAEPFLLMVVKGHQILGQACGQGAHATEERRRSRWRHTAGCGGGVGAGRHRHW